MLNPLTTLIVQDITDNIDSDVVTGLVTSNEMSITGLVGSDDILLSALVKADSTIFLDLDAYSYLKQDAYDPRINGEDKTVVGAINNLIQAVKDINISITNLDDTKLDKVTTKGTEDVYVSDVNGNQITIVCTVETEPNTIVKIETPLSMEAGELVTISCTYSPRMADVDFGLITPQKTFRYLPGEDGLCRQTIQISQTGNYYFAVRNNSSGPVEVLGYVYY